MEYLPVEKFCKKCVYHRRATIRPNCGNPEAVGRDPVTGRVNVQSCESVRLEESKCGWEGKHWTRKRSVLERLRDKRRELVLKLDERY